MSKTESAEMVRGLLARTKRGDDKPTIYTVLRRVSASGMTRWLDLYVMVDNEPRRITWPAAEVMGWTYDRKHDALKVGGCGMDLGFHTVYTLSRYLFKDAPEGMQVKDAGYEIRHEWM